MRLRTKTTVPHRRGGLAGLALALLAGVALVAVGCGGEEGPAERAGEQIDETMEQMEESARDLFEEEGAAERAGEEMDEAAEEAGEDMEKAAEEMEEAAEAAEEEMEEAVDEAEQEMGR